MKTLIVDNHSKHLEELKSSFENATVVSREEIKNISPEGFYEVVRSNHSPEIIKHRTLPIIGIQFHPEVGVIKKLWGWILV